MRNIDEIIINKVYISALDKENNALVLSEAELELNEETYEYFEKHILRCIRDDEAKPGRFEGDVNIVRELCKEIFEEEDDFLLSSKKLAQFIYKCMGNDDKEQSGDFAVCLCDSQQGLFIALLKLNYSDSYSHFIKQEEDAVTINIGINKTGLPGLGQKLARAAFVRKPISKVDEYDFLTYDKQPEGYFCQAFLRVSPVRDKRENTRIIQKTSESFARRAFKDNAQEAEGFRKKLTDTLMQEDRVNVESLMQNLLPTEERRAEYKAALVNEGISETDVTIDREWAEKKLKRKRLKVDKSIELYIDDEVYNDKDKFQIKRNGDGTIDIILKNVKNYIER
ncbi:MAG: hypothetical protein A2Y23_06855 [Clostridiales bacterium GWB2_37_7]|nr:MAG: hypothetical protein A2Y23_06855 [Clostridiales bacterium GWB2_37_7]